MKNKLRFFFSMKFAIGVLIVLALVCTLGSIIPQGHTEEWYTQNYSSVAAGAILLFGLGDVFHAWWFVVLTVILCANLLGCNLVHLPGLIRRTRSGFSAENAASAEAEPVVSVDDPEGLFRALGFRHVEKTADEVFYAVKNRAGIWGPWLCHFGMLIIIIGFGLGQSLKTEYSVYGIPGQTKPVGDTDYALTIDDFRIDYTEEGNVRQYTSDLTMTDTVSGESRQGTASVNHPSNLFGMKLFQNSTGWAAFVQIYKDGELLQEDPLCVGEYTYVKDLPDLAITLAGFYPDYTEDPQTGLPYTPSEQIKNPAYLYRLYYQEQVLGMNVLPYDEEITVENYTFRFVQPSRYSLIQIKKDPFTGLVAVGGLILLTALVLAFYIRTAEIWARKEPDGTWAVYGRSRKGGAEFLEQIRYQNRLSKPKIRSKVTLHN